MILDSVRIKGGCDVSRGTRGKEHLSSALSEHWGKQLHL